MPTTQPRTRFLAALALAIATLTAFAAAPAGARAPKAAGPSLAIESKTCSTGADADQRFIVLTASAVLRDTGDEVQMRFTVQQRATVKTPWRSVFAKTGDLGTWATSDPGADGLRYTKTINGLAEGSQYRVVVEARGIEAGGKVVTKTTRKTYTCIEPQITPHPVPVRATPDLDPTAAHPPRVKVLVRNTGRTASGPIVVTVRDASTQAILGQSTLDALSGHASTIVNVGIHECPGTITVTTQPEGADLTSLSSDQTISVPCPGSSTTATQARRAGARS